MQARVINGGDLASNALLYGTPDPSLIEYLQTNVSRVMEATKGAINTFTTGVQNMYNRFNNSAAINAAKALLYSSGSSINESTIEYYSMDNYHPNLYMQRYIMAYPEVSNLYKQNMIDGFSDTYFNIEPDTYKEDRSEYMQVMDGVLQEDKDHNVYVKYYSDSNDMPSLEASEKMAILQAWDIVANKIALGKDPTDIE